MLSSEKLDDLGSAAPHAYVTYQNTSEWLTANYLIAYKVLLTASHIYIHLKSTILGYVLERIVMLYPYALTTFVNVLSFLDVCFVFKATPTIVGEAFIFYL